MKVKKRIQNIRNYVFERKYLLAIPFFILLILYLHYVNSLTFGFTDAYQSYVRAYFMLKGRTLFAEIFSHHNFLMVYLSYALQYILEPKTLYQLVMMHRIFIALLSVMFSILLIWRFKWAGVLFVAVFSVSKYYLFGNLFLAESIVAYLLVFLLGAAWEKMRGGKLTRFDIVLTIFFSWAVVFLREPFIPLAALLFAYILADKKFLYTKVIAITTLTLFSIILIVATLNISEYYYHLITLNFSGYIQEELGDGGSKWISLLKSFIYPLVILFEGKYSDFRIILVLVDVLFIFSLIYNMRQKKYKFSLLLLLMLGLANIRLRTPGSTFYEGFHMLPYYALLIFSGVKMAHESSSKYLKWGGVIITICVVLISILPPHSTAVRELSRDEEFTTNYGRFYSNGEVIKALADKDDKLFVDRWDTLIFWQTGMDSSYKYAMYFPVMSKIDKYTKEYSRMFQQNPPEYYYTGCDEKSVGPLNFKTSQPLYVRIYFNDEPSCIFLLRDKVSEISQEKWNLVNSMGYHLKI